MAEPLTHALSFDIEDWFHMVEIPAVADRTKWGEYSSLVERYTDWIVETVGKANVKATFYMLGWVAERHPEIARKIAAAGHEVGCHSYLHRRVDQLTLEEFRDDTARAKDILEQQTGQRVLGYRAPSFSVTPGAEWAFDVLHELGFAYDASLFPAPRGHGGYPCVQEVHDFKLAPSGRPMRELPMSIMRYGPLKIPFSGGGYMRVLPEWMIRRGFEKFTAAGTPVVVYLHPRDFAVDCPRVPMPLHRRFKCYTGMETTARKLEMLLARYRFTTCAEVAGIVQ